MNKLNYDFLKQKVKLKGDRIQKSGVYFNIFFDDTKIYNDKEIDLYLNNLSNVKFKIIGYVKDHLNFDLSKRNIKSVQFKMH